MEADRLFLALAVVAVIVSLSVLSFSYFNNIDLISRISGYATGTTNLTVETQAAINFTTAVVNFGSGKVDSGASSASLFTIGSGTVTGGNWTASSGLILENIGNVNVSLNITVGKNASNFIGGTNPVYEINVSNVEAGSCINSSTFALGFFYSANTSNTLLNCNVFRFESSLDSIRIDFNLTIPENSLTGALGDVITATATAL